jgi:hypothetical protein
MRSAFVLGYLQGDYDLFHLLLELFLIHPNRLQSAAECCIPDVEMALKVDTRNLEPDVRCVYCWHTAPDDPQTRN